MISLAEFDRAQVLLKRKDAPRPLRHTFTYTGLWRCGQCGRMITAEHQVNRFGSRYVYYHCTRRKPGPTCQQASVELKILEGQLTQFVSTLVIPQRFHKLTASALAARMGPGMDTVAAQKASITTALEAAAKARDTLLSLRMRDLITDEEFLG